MCALSSRLMVVCWFVVQAVCCVGAGTVQGCELGSRSHDQMHGVAHALATEGPRVSLDSATPFIRS
jgi:hypothetical protein